MKYKKYSYILVLILMLIVGINGVYAAHESKTCYYMSGDGNFKTRIELKWHYTDEWYTYLIPFYGIYDFFATVDTASYADVVVDKVGDNNYINDDEFVANWVPDTYDNCIKGGSVCFDTVYPSIFHANGDFNKYTEPSCPTYVIYQDTTFRWIWVTNSQTKAQKAETDIKNQGYTGFYGSLTTANEYWKDEIAAGIIEIDDGEVTCADYETIFGDLNDDGDSYDPDGDKQPSIRYYINLVLQYVRIIVPILVIVLGMLDFAKAVMAGKEDNMKKAQSDFVKRVLMGVAVFFVPLLVDIIMDLADIIWNGAYPHCGL